MVIRFIYRKSSAVIAPSAWYCRLVMVTELESQLLFATSRQNTPARERHLKLMFWDNGAALSSAPRRRFLIQKTNVCANRKGTPWPLRKKLEVGGPVFASKDARDGPRAFAEKRKPVFEGK